MAIFGSLYERVMQWSRHRHAEWYLGAMSFAESSFFPIPVDVMLAPMCMAQPDKSWRFALNATVFSVLGGVAGYGIGYLTFEAIEPWLRDSHYWEHYLTARNWFDDYGLWTVFVAGFSPIPYKVFTIAAGVAALTLPGFFVASLIGRGARFFLVAAFVRYAGVRMEATLLRHIERIGWGVLIAAVIIVGWLMSRN
ncbi:MAG: DedA family protein [Gammaproteobacteria bacterium]|nr:DedA family protein [Gammaproteobacteria bacterium]NNC77859.1 DedA family protein [Woeseiaceae bacterium]